MKEITIIDYGMCNLDSVARAVEKCGGRPIVSGNAADVETAAALILPGVGSFNDAMRELTNRNLDTAIRAQVNDKKIPFLGICLGMQLMATTGHEGGEKGGLDLIPGEVVRLEPATAAEKIPHVGWNEVHHAGHELFAGIADATDFYFVHSFHFRCDTPYILGRTPFCGGFISAVGRARCLGVQFHPEKSLAAGQTLLKNFIHLC